MALIRNAFYILFMTIFTLIALEVVLFAAFSIRDIVSGNEAPKTSENPNQDEETRRFQNDAQSFQSYPYKAFVGWQSPQISSETLNIDDNLRRITVNSNPPTDHKVHFFGGSTMWGHSVSDKNTIPSHFSNLTGKTAINYGEQAYNSRQSLNRLLNTLDSIEPGDNVVFFDGVNDVYHNCLSLNSPDGHPREGFIKEKLSGKSGSIWMLVSSTSTYRLAHRISEKLDSGDNGQRFDDLNQCSDPAYAQRVADFLISSWAATEAIVNSRGARFSCVLQPNPYTLPDRPFSHNETYAAQIQQVYPLIREKAQELDCFQDYSGILQQDFYIDHCCHVNAQGNLEIARRFAQDLN